jgi:hypothetical protein
MSRGTSIILQATTKNARDLWNLLRLRILCSKPDEFSICPYTYPWRPTVPRHEVCMTAESSAMSETIECPRCLGEGTLERTEVLDRLGVKDFARVAQLSAEEALRLLQQKHNHDQQSVVSRFETELVKRTAEIRERHKDERLSAQSQRDDGAWTQRSSFRIAANCSSARRPVPSRRNH